MPNARNLTDLSFVTDSVHDSIRPKNHLANIVSPIFGNDATQLWKFLEAVCLGNQFVSEGHGAAEGDRLDVLVTLVASWEEKHWPIDLPDPVEAILFAMEQRGLSRKELEPFIGSRARVAEVLNHKRPLTLPMIRRLHQGLGIPAEVLIGESVAA